MENRETKMKTTRDNRGKEKRWKVWWRQLRPFTLTAAIIPVLIGTTMAMSFTSIDLLLFSAMLIASILIQAATNFFNEYYDYQRGLDTEESVGIGGGIVRDGIHPRTILTTAIVFFAIAILLGVYICINSSWWVAVIGLVSMAIGYLYTGGPYPIAYTPFGELFSGFFMGTVITLITFFIQTGTVTVDAILLSIPISILIGTILTANSIRDLDEDIEQGRKTLAIVLGREKAIIFLGSMFAIAYLWTGGLVVAGQHSPWLLIVFISVPRAVQAVRGFQGKTEPVQMMPAMKATASLHTIFGLLFSFGLFLGT